MHRVDIWSRNSRRIKSFTFASVVNKHHCAYCSWINSDKCIFPRQGSSGCIPSFSCSPVNCIVCHGLDISIITVSNIMLGTIASSISPLRKDTVIAVWHARRVDKRDGDNANVQVIIQFTREQMGTWHELLHLGNVGQADMSSRYDFDMTPTRETRSEQMCTWTMVGIMIGRNHPSCSEWKFYPDGLYGIRILGMTCLHGAILFCFLFCFFWSGFYCSYLCPYKHS